MTTHACTLRSLLAVILLAAGPALAGTLSYMSDTPYANFTKEDHAIFAAAMKDALEKGADGESRSWSNPATKANGELKPVDTFERKGLKCRRMYIANKAKGRSASSEYNFCRQSTGKWTLAD